MKKTENHENHPRRSWARNHMGNPSFITYDGRSDLYWSLGDASISSYGSVCSSGGSVSYKAEMTLTKTYSFGNKGTYAWRTPTAMGYRLQTHGWLRPYQIEGSWAQTFNFSD